MRVGAAAALFGVALAAAGCGSAGVEHSVDAPAVRTLAFAQYVRSLTDRSAGAGEALLHEHAAIGDTRRLLSKLEGEAVRARDDATRAVPAGSLARSELISAARETKAGAHFLTEFTIGHRADQLRHGVTHLVRARSYLAAAERKLAPAVGEQYESELARLRAPLLLDPRTATSG